MKPLNIIRRVQYQEFIIPLLSIATSLIIGAVIIYSSGADVYKAYQGLWQGAFGKPRAIAETLVITTPYIQETACLPKLIPTFRLHWGFIIAIAAVFLIYFILYKTTTGFEISTVGLNQNAARYAGMNITRNFILAMSVSGGLAGLAGANEVLGLRAYPKTSNSILFFF